MKHISFLLILFAGLTVFSSCKNEPKPDTAKSPAENPATAAKEGEEILEERVTNSVAKIYDIDLANTAITWKASKKIGGGHSGSFKTSMGRLAYDQGRIVAGEINIDMNSLNILDDMGDMKGKLMGHLKSGDFFDTGNHPEATFLFQKIQPEKDVSNGYNYTVAGPLTLRGISKIVTIPANVDVQADKITVTTPPFTINRTQWGIKYNSGLLGTAADKIINDDVQLNINAIFVPR